MVKTNCRWNFCIYNCRWFFLSTIVDEFFIYNCRWIFLSTIEIVEVVEVIVEVMGVVEVIEVSLLSVEVTSLQKSKSLRVVPHRFFSHWIKKSKVAEWASEWQCHLLSCRVTAKNILNGEKHPSGLFVFQNVFSFLPHQKHCRAVVLEGVLSDISTPITITHPSNHL